MATYLVTQASGKQSGWVIKHLIASGAKVHALVRNDAPESLNHPNITVFRGEGHDADAVYAAAKGTQGVFLNTFPFPDLQRQQVKAILEASKKAGLETVVVTTGFFSSDKAVWDDDATKETGLQGYFESKLEVEDSVRQSGIKNWTILRPGFINYDYLAADISFRFPELVHGELAHIYNDGVGMLHTDASDIGKYAAAALQDPARFSGEEIELSYEYLTMPQVADVISRVTGKEVRVRKRSAEEAAESAKVVMAQGFYAWANVKVKELTDLAQGAKDVQAKFGIPFTSLEESLRRDKDLLPQF